MPSNDYDILPAVTTFVDEIIDETIGRSSKKWALLLLAFGVGAAIALWLARRRRGLVDPAITRPEVGTT